MDYQQDLAFSPFYNSYPPPPPPSSSPSNTSPASQSPSISPLDQSDDYELLDRVRQCVFDPNFELEQQQCAQRLSMDYQYHFAQQQQAAAMCQDPAGWALDQRLVSTSAGSVPSLSSASSPSMQAEDDFYFAMPEVMAMPSSSYYSGAEQNCFPMQHPGASMPTTMGSTAYPCFSDDLSPSQPFERDYDLHAMTRTSSTSSSSSSSFCSAATPNTGMRLHQRNHSAASPCDWSLVQSPTTTTAPITKSRTRPTPTSTSSSSSNNSTHRRRKSEIPAAAAAANNSSSDSRSARRDSSPLSATSPNNINSTTSSSSSSSSCTQQHRCFDHGCNGKIFSCAENLRRHVRERSIAGKDKIKCPYCHMAFSRKSNRDTHLSGGRCKVVYAWGEELAQQQQQQQQQPQQQQW